MRSRIIAVVWMALAIPALAVAGTARATVIPTLGESGIVLVAVGLVATGIAVLRDRKH